MFEPQNEMGVVYEFARQAHLSGWELVEIGAAFPDAVLSMKGEQWVAEFEYAASSFIAHGHDMREVDVIVCWVNDYPDCPIPVIALSESGWMFTELFRVDANVKAAEYWKQRALRAERRLMMYPARYDSNNIDDDRLPEDVLGMGDSAIADMVGVSRQAVYQWRKSGVLSTKILERLPQLAAPTTNGKEHA